MPIVTIKTLSTERNRWGETFEDISVLIDGEEIGSGWYGGEPEDNRKSRTYKWVEPLIQKLAEKLGAEVKVEHTEKPFQGKC